MGKFTTLAVKQQNWTMNDEQASVSSTTSKRSWFNKLSSLVTRPRRSLDSASESARRSSSPSPSPTVRLAAHDPLRAAVTANWVANARANASTPPANAWRSEVTLHPSSHYHVVTMHQPPAMYSLPSGPTALAPSPHMTGSTSQRRARAYTSASHTPVSAVYVAVPAALPSPGAFGQPSATPRILPPRAPTPTQLPPVASQAQWGVYTAQQPSTRPRTQSQRQASPRPTHVSRPSVPTVVGSTSWTQASGQHVYAMSSDNASSSSTSLTVADALGTFPQLGDGPSAWSRLDMYASKRASTSSTHTFGS